jgi:thioester reductase-like protein
MNRPLAAKDILLTGATGLVGGELLPRFLAAWPEATVYCLIRARDAEHLEQRRVELLERMGLPGGCDRVVAVAGDVSQPGLGIADPDLPLRIAHLFHAAAGTRLDGSLDAAREINLLGTQHALDFARRAKSAGALQCLHYVSTAFVTGDLPGTLVESASDEPGSFRNPYERSKWEADRLIGDAAAELPAICYRPSIIVGDSRTGRTVHFRVLYDPIKWILHGKIEILPCDPAVRVDVVPVDYVCDAIVALARLPEARGRTLNITAGPANAANIEQLLDIVAVAVIDYETERGLELSTKPRIVSPNDEASKNLGRMFELSANVMRTHLPYMLSEQLFDPAAAEALLGPDGPKCPHLADYMATLIVYGLDHNFGVN